VNDDVRCLDCGGTIYLDETQDRWRHVKHPAVHNARLLEHPGSDDTIDSGTGKDDVNFFRSLGMKPDRDLRQDCADWYLLEWLAQAQQYDPARRRFDQLTRELAVEFETYLDMAVGGELRHAVHVFRGELPASLASYWQSVRATNGDRSLAWREWTRLRREQPRETLVKWVDWAQRLFGDGDRWSSGEVGGPRWAAVASVYKLRLIGRGTDTSFVDRCFTLEHNFGAVFDKVYEVDGLTKVLETQMQNDYQGLRRWASPEVVELMNEWKLQQRSDFDSGWLGR